MRQLPTGTVTFLFTDIEGSTRLLHELGAERYAEALTEHRRLVRGAIERHRGTEVDTEGDAFFVAFARATDAVAAAGEAQKALAVGPVRVRMGLHTGEPLLAEDHYVGIDVHRAARVMAAGHGGQVLLSQTTRELLDEAFELRDLGEHRLKDLSAPQRLYQLGDREFPRLKTLHQTNLPVQPTGLVGRGRELAEAGELLRLRRLLTLLGPGGTGKTRLALQLAAEAVDEFADGVWWVSLAALSDPDLVEATIAQAVGAKDGLAAHLHAQRALLLLDNFEHLLAAAPRVAQLLAEAPDVKALVTSRAPLHLKGEQEYPVPPLADEEAVALFVERARAIKPAFAPDEHVAEICRRLDGLPLALELAAARIRLLPAAKLRERLEERLPLLTGGARDAPERQRTLRATIEWSYDLLDQDDRGLFVRLAVFAGSFSLEAAEEICEADLDTIASLVEKSLLRETDEGRFFMLETIREYAIERLREGADAEEMQRRHALHYLDMAERLEPELEHRFGDVSPVVSQELGNLRAAMSWLAERGDAERRIRVAAALWRFWLNTGDVREAASWLERSPEPLSPSVEASALRAISWLFAVQGKYEDAARAAEERLANARSSGDVRSICGSLQLMAHLAAERGDHARALRLLEEEVEVARAGGDPAALSAALMNLGAAVKKRGEYGRARALIQEALSYAERVGSDNHTASALAALADVAFEEHAPDASNAVRRSIAEAWRLGWESLLPWPLSAAALFTARKGDAHTAASLVGSVDALHARRGTTPDSDERRVRDLIDAELDAQLSADERAEASARGAAVPLGDAVEKAIASLD